MYKLKRTLAGLNFLFPKVSKKIRCTQICSLSDSIIICSFGSFYLYIIYVIVLYISVDQLLNLSLERLNFFYWTLFLFSLVIIIPEHLLRWAENLLRIKSLGWEWQWGVLRTPKVGRDKRNYLTKLSFPLGQFTNLQRFNLSDHSLQFPRQSVCSL